MSDKRDLSTNDKKEISLHETGSKAGTLIQQSVRSLNEEQKQALGAKAAEELIRLEIKEREIGMEYIAGKKSAEDHVETWGMLKGDGKLTTRQSVTSEIKTGAGKMHIESKSGATCFVATATYRDPFHPDVIFLRWFRDNFLVYFKLGLRFIDWYWIYGPKLARLLENSELLRRFSKFFLNLLVNLLRHPYICNLCDRMKPK